MTLGICVECSDGILLACDSRTIFGRGVPIQRETNKVHVLNKQELLSDKIAFVGAGTNTFIEKFLRMCEDTNLSEVSASSVNEEIPLHTFINKVAEPIVATLYSEYVKSRDYSTLYNLSLIIGGVEPHVEEGEKNLVKAYVLHDIGLSEPLEGFSTVGSGAAYAELFLRYLLPESRSIEEVIKPVYYTIKLVETIDPYVGGKVNLTSIKEDGKTECLSDKVPEIHESTIQKALDDFMKQLKEELNYGEQPKER